MATLITKLQYRNYETGEFTGEKERTLAETFALISSYPWEEQRQRVSMALTNPSVTIQGPAGEFLKLAIYFNGSFVLYYLDAAHHLYTRKLNSVAEASSPISNFFTQQTSGATFDHEGFHREQTPFQNNAVHFRDKSFSYTASPLLLTLPVIFIGFTTFFLFAILTHLRSALHAQPYGYLSLLPCILLTLVTVPITILYANHWRAARGRVLILSRGKDIFYYGPADSPTAYSKDDILEVVTVGARGRNGYPRTTQVEIDFKNGTALYLSCLLLPQYEMVSKFPQCRQRTQKTIFPFIPAGS